MVFVKDRVIDFVLVTDFDSRGSGLDSSALLGMLLGFHVAGHLGLDCPGVLLWTESLFSLCRGMGLHISNA